MSLVNFFSTELAWNEIVSRPSEPTLGIYDAILRHVIMLNGLWQLFLLIVLGQVQTRPFFSIQGYVLGNAFLSLISDCMMGRFQREPGGLLNPATELQLPPVNYTREMGSTS